MQIGYALTGSFCTFERSFETARQLVAAGHTLLPILSFAAAETDTRFGKAADVIETLTDICGVKPLMSLPAVEPIGPKQLIDALIVAPCTGSTLGRLACGISETPVTLAVKSQLRVGKPVILAASTNDALGMSMQNIAVLKNVKNVYFVPMKQDDPLKKPNSLVADFTRIADTLTAAMQGRQIQPLFL